MLGGVPGSYKWIICDPSYFAGRPTVREARIPVAQLVKTMNLGATLEDLREMYGDRISREV